MSARNVFILLAGVLIVVVLLVGTFIWNPFSTSYLVSDQGMNSGTTSANSSDVGVSHTPAVHTVKEGNHYVTVISYNGSTFSPRVLVINRGENVRFVNTSNLTMRIEADRSASSTLPDRYQEAQSVGKNGTYELSFPNPGVWVVDNINDTSTNSMVIYVK